MRRAEKIRNVSCIDRDLVRFSLCDSQSDFPPETADRPFQLSHASLARVTRRDQVDSGVSDFELLWSQTVLAHLARDQIATGYLELLTIAVTGELDHFHANAQRWWKRAELISRSDKENFREIERQIQIMIREGVVLLGIQNLQQRSRRIATIIRAQFVDLVEHHYRVVNSGTTN